MSKKDWNTIGYLPVDAGCLMIVDPCYVLDDQDLMTEASNEDRHVYLNEVATEWKGFKPIFKNLGMLVETGWGDGRYPVKIRYGHDNRVAEVKVVFDEEEY